MIILVEALSGHSVFSEILLGKKSGKNEIFAAIPIFRNKLIVGALIARLDVGFLAEYVKTRGVYGEDGIGYILSVILVPLFLYPPLMKIY